VFNETSYFNDQTRAEVEAEVAANKAKLDAAEAAYYRAQGWPVISIDSTGDNGGGSTPYLDLSGGGSSMVSSTNWLLYGGLGLMAFMFLSGGRKR
jgi:hypothetical protein